MTKAGFGEHLKREREMRGVSLDEVCAATRIGTRFLEALENEQWQQLPGGVFNRGFVRAVARFLGLDEDGMVAEYVLAMSEHTGAPASMWTSQQPQHQLAGHWPANPTPNWPLRMGLLVAVLLLAGTGWMGWRWYGSRHAQRSAQTITSSPDAAATANSSSDASSPAAATHGGDPGSPAGTAGANAASSSGTNPATAASSGANASTANPSTANPSAGNSSRAASAASSSVPTSAPSAAPAQFSGLQLKIEASKATAVTVAADGRQIFRATIVAGQSRTFNARNRIAVHAQDAGAVSLELNGQNIAPIGRPGRPARIALTRRDVKTAGGVD